MNQTEALARCHALLGIDLDLDQLVKGNTISKEELLQLYKDAGAVKPYWQWLQGVKAFIEEYAAAAGRPVVVRQKDHALAILTDAEAVIYTRKRFERGIRDAHLSRVKMDRVDEKALTRLQKKAHTRNKYEADDQLNAVRQARHRLGLPEAGARLSAQIKTLPEGYWDDATD